MAFLDDIGKAFSNAGQKTKDMADIAKINSMLSEEEKKMNNLCMQIGKAYVQLHPLDYDEALAAYFQAYRESEKQIADFNARLRQLKNIISCPGCGGDIPSEAAFCSKCGYRMPPKPVTVPPGSVVCKACGAFVPQTMKFCTSCGAPMSLPTPSVPMTSMPNPAYASQAQVPYASQAQVPYASQTQVPYASQPQTQFPPQQVPVAPPVAPPPAPVEPLPEPDPIILPEPTEPPLDLFAPLSEHALPDAPQPQGATCANCGSDLESDCAFCVVCGTPVNATEPAADASSDVCPSCGAKLDGDSLFCIECGSKVK